jgi:hypothetical protein
MSEAEQWVREAAKVMPPEPKTMKELEDLYVVSKAARDAFSEGVKATAEKTGYSTIAIRRAVRATVDDKIEKAATEVREVAELLNLETFD